MSLTEDAFLFTAALLGGALNSVAGGGSFIALPALLFTGVAPVVANATNTIALWPGTIASAFAYRREIDRSRGFILALSAASVAGGIAGALLLLGTSDETFIRLLPWLLLLATVLFTFGGAATKRMGARAEGRGGSRIAAGGIALQLLIATYGGYFGGGMGIMMLATLSLLGLTNIHAMNAVKTVLGAIINGVAVVAFVVAGAVAWRPGLVMVAGAVAGGYYGAHFARRLEPGRVRRFVIAVGWAMTVYFFYAAYVSPN